MDVCVCDSSLSLASKQLFAGSGCVGSHD